MFKKVILTFAILFASNQGFANLSCSVEEDSDYMVEVSTDSNRAALFNNNAWSIVNLSSDTNNVQVYSGKDE